MFKRVLVLSSFLLMFVGFSAWADNITQYCQFSTNGELLGNATCINNLEEEQKASSSNPFSVNVLYGSANTNTKQYSGTFSSFQSAVQTFSDNGLSGFNYNADRAFIAGNATLTGVNFLGAYWFGPQAGNPTDSCGDAGCHENIYLSFKDASGQTTNVQFSSGQTYQPTGANGTQNNSIPPAFDSATGNDIITGNPGESLSTLLQNWLKSSAGQSFLTDFLKTTVSVAPFSPVAGNPSSYMGQAVQENFDIANLINFQTGPVSGLNLFNLSPTYSTYNADGATEQLYSLPLRDIYYINDSNALIFDFPISYADTVGSQTYAVSAGLAYVHSFALPASITWSLSPSAHIGADGSQDFASGTLIYNGGFSSNIALPVDQFTFNLVDNATYLKTVAVNIQGYETNYDIDNTLTENGVDINYAINPKFSVGTNYSNTYVISGQPWFIKDYNQTGGNISLNKDYKGAVYNFLTIGASYLFAPHFNGVTINLSLNF
jgi:hypothetical protein